jgi:hypothetical protein
MTPLRTARSEIVVLTPASRRLSGLVTSLRRLGASVAVAGSERRVRRLLGEAPVFVLVDLAHGAPLTPVPVAMLNHLQDSGRALVLALHAGELEQRLEAAELHVAGFCHIDEWRRLAAYAAAFVRATRGPGHEVVPAEIWA